MVGAIVAIVVVLIVVGGVAGAIMSYFSLQKHRSDAVAMASYRKLAEEAVVNQQELFGKLDDLRERVDKVEELLRSVE